MKILKVYALFFAAIFATFTVSADEKSAPSYITSEAAKAANLPFSEAVRVGNTLYLSGQIGAIPSTRKLAEGGIKAETQQTMENIKGVLARQNLTMDNIFKCTVMLADISEWASFNEVYVPFFKKHFPARSAFAASGLAMNSRVEVECMAHIP